MDKITWIGLAKGEPKVGKTGIGLTAEGSILIDMTPDRNGMAAAFNAFGDEFDDRYFHIDQDSEKLLEVIEEHEDAKTICIDEGKNLRDAFAKPVLDEINEERRRIKKNATVLKTIYPTTEWKRVYNDIDAMFRKYDGVHNFMITEGLKDKRIFDSESKQSVVTGKRVADGLNTLPTICDFVLHVSLHEKTVGSPPKIERSRKVKVVVNRFLDYAGEGWVEYVKDIPDLIDKICENSKFRKEMFLI